MCFCIIYVSTIKLINILNVCKQTRLGFIFWLLSSVRNIMGYLSFLHDDTNYLFIQLY